MGGEDAIERLDVSNPDEIIAGIERREIAKAKAVKEQEMLKLVSGSRKK